MEHRQAHDQAPDLRPDCAPGELHCEDCNWYRTQIRRAAFDPKGQADLTALFARHLHAKHDPEKHRSRPLRSV